MLGSLDRIIAVDWHPVSKVTQSRCQLCDLVGARHRVARFRCECRVRRWFSICASSPRLCQNAWHTRLHHSFRHHAEIAENTRSGSHHASPFRTSSFSISMILPRSGRTGSERGFSTLSAHREPYLEGFHVVDRVMRRTSHGSCGRAVTSLAVMLGWLEISIIDPPAVLYASSHLYATSGRVLEYLPRHVSRRILPCRLFRRRRYPRVRESRWVTSMKVSSSRTCANGGINQASQKAGRVGVSERLTEHEP
jgi:hypothetical protein